MSKKKKRNKHKGKFKSQVFSEMQNSQSTESFSKPNIIQEKPAEIKDEERNEEEMYFKKDMKKLGLSLGVVILLFAVVIIANNQTKIVSDFGNQVVEFSRINR